MTSYSLAEILYTANQSPRSCNRYIDDNPVAKSWYDLAKDKQLIWEQTAQMLLDQFDIIIKEGTKDGLR